MKKIYFLLILLAIIFALDAFLYYQFITNLPDTLMENNNINENAVVPQLNINQQVNINQTGSDADIFRNFQVIFHSGGGLSKQSIEIIVTDSGEVTGKIIDGFKFNDQTIRLTADQLAEFKKLLLAADILKLADKYACEGMCPTDSSAQNLRITTNNYAKIIEVNDWGKLPSNLRALMEWFSPQADAFYANQDDTKIVNLNSLVLDKNSKRPVTGAIVYIGTGNWQCQTYERGYCTIANKQFAPGEYAVNVYKKGYNRLVINKEFMPGSNSLTLEIEATTMPQSITVAGTVIEVIAAPGSMSENHYYKIKTETGEEYYLFNEIGYNSGFEGSVNKKATVTGYKDKGFIGWQHQETEGIYIEEMLVEQTPDLSCAQDSDCKISPTICQPCDCGDAVNVNWKEYCPFMHWSQIYCGMCPPYQAKCLNNKCQRELIKM